MKRTADVTQANAAWKACHAAVPGLKHRRAAQPGQDACLACADGAHPFLVVCDGRGSASHADLGAEGTVSSIAMQMEHCCDLLAVCLDGGQEEAANAAFDVVVKLLCRTAAQTQSRLAAQYRQAPELFEHTFLVACIGRQRFGWLQVGDGGFVIQRRGKTENIGSQEHHECANLTHFVSVAEPFDGLQKGLLPAGDITAVAGFTDGTAGRMLRSTDHLPAPAFAGLWDLLRAGRQTPGDLAGFLRRPDWEPAVTDDRSLALLARIGVTVKPGAHPHPECAPPGADVKTANDTRHPPAEATAQRPDAAPRPPDQSALEPAIGKPETAGCSHRDVEAVTGCPVGIVPLQVSRAPEAPAGNTPAPWLSLPPRTVALVAALIGLAGLLHGVTDVRTGNDPSHHWLLHVTIAATAAAALVLACCQQVRQRQRRRQPGRPLA